MKKATEAAIVRTMICLNMNKDEVRGYAKSIFEAAGIKKKDGLAKILESLKDQTRLECFCREIEKLSIPIEFIEIFLGINLSDSLSQISKNLAADYRTMSLLKSGADIKAWDDYSMVHYMERPEDDFRILKRDFTLAKHLAFLEKLKEDNPELDKLMFICEKIDTGLLALKYLLEPKIDIGSHGEKTTDFFDGKVLLLTGEEVDSAIEGASINIDNFFSGPFGFQVKQNVDSKDIWWLERSDIPLVIILKENQDIGTSFPEKLICLSESHKIFIIVEKKSNNATKFNPDIEFGHNLDGILEDISFNLNYQAYKVIEPEIRSPYMEKIFLDFAFLEGYLVDKSVKIAPLLEKFKQSRNKTRKWQGNPTVQMLIKKAISFKSKAKDDKILRNEDFTFFETGYLLYDNQIKNENDKEKVSAWEKMNSSIFGLDHVKREMADALLALEMGKKREKLGLSNSGFNNVFAFYGPPGVGKTEMARYFGEIMKEKGLLEGNKFLSINGAQLKGQFVGQSAPKVAGIFAAYDIIFIDECYSLTSSETINDSYSEEALAELCIQLEKCGKEKLIIFAGYGGNIGEKNNKMKEFLYANPGLASRITFHVNFPSYTPKEMVGIFKKILDYEEYKIEPGFEALVINFTKKRMNTAHFGNGRDARKLFQHALKVQNKRVSTLSYTKENLMNITLEDLGEAIATIERGEFLLGTSTTKVIGF